MVYINSRSRVTLSLLLSACVYSNLASAGILDGLYTTTTAYTGTDVQTYSTQYFKNILGLTVSTLYYVETPYSNYSVDIYSNWDQSTTSTYITQEEYYIGTDSIGTHATVYYVVTPQSNDISVISTYGDYLSTTTYSTSYNLVSTTVDLDSVGLSAFGLSSAVTSTSTTYYVATPLSRSTTTFYIASSVYASETLSILGNVVTDGTSPYVLESVYIATPINPLVSSSVDLYVGSTVTTYSTSISTDTAGTQHTVYYISSPYPVSKVTGLNFWGNTYSSISTVSSHITTNSAGSSIEEEYYVLYEPTPDAKSTKFTYWPGSTTSTYSTGYQSTSELIFSIDLYNLLLFWEWFQEKTFTYTTFYVKTPYSSAIANSYSYEASITTPSTYKTQTTTFFGINNQPTVETIYYIATPLASGESISYSNWDGNDAVTISTYTTNGTTVKVVLEPYPTTTIHSVTTDVPSITAVETYKSATETTIIDGATYIATVLDINVPLVTTIYTSVNQSSGVTAMETVGSSTSLAEVTTPANVFNDQLSEIVNTYTFTTYNIVYPLYIDITNSGIAGSNPTTYSTSASYISLNDDTTETIEIYYVATPAPTTFTTDVVSGSSTVEEAVSYYYTTGTDGKSTLTSGVSTIVTAPTTFTTDVVSGSSTAEEAVSYYYTTGTDGKSTLTSGVSTVSAGITGPTTFTTDVVSGSSTIEEAISYYYTTGTDGKSSLTSGVSIVNLIPTSSYLSSSSGVIVPTSSSPPGSAVTSLLTSSAVSSIQSSGSYYSSAPLSSLFTSSYVGPRYTNSSIASSSGSSSKLTSSIIPQTSGSSSRSLSSSSVSSSTSTSSVCATEDLKNYIADQTAYYNFSVSSVEYSEFYVVADLDQSSGDASLSFDLYSSCSSEFTPISDNVEEDNSTTSRLWQHIELSEVPSQTNGLLDAKLVVPLIAGTTSTHQVVNFVVPIYSNKRDTLVSEYLVYTFVLDASTNGINFSTNVESSRLISIYEAASEFGITTPSSNTESTSILMSTTSVPASTSSASVIESSTSIASTTSSTVSSNNAGNTVTSGAQNSTPVSTATPGSGSTGNESTTESKQSPAAYPTESSPSNGASNVGSNGSQRTNTVSNDQTTLMTITNCGTKTCTVLATQASNTGSVESNESSYNVNSIGSNKATATSNTAAPTATSNTAAPTANGQVSTTTSTSKASNSSSGNKESSNFNDASTTAPTTGGSNTENLPSSSATTPITLATSIASATPIITTQSSYNNGAISNIKGYGSFWKNLLFMTISVMFFI